MSMNDETFFTPARTPMPRIAARSVSAVVDRAPATIPSKLAGRDPGRAPTAAGPARCRRASSRVTPRRAARSRYARSAGSASRPVGTAATSTPVSDDAGRGALPLDLVRRPEQRDARECRCATARAAAWTVRGSVPSGSTMCRAATRGPRTWIRARTSMRTRTRHASH